jgi:hypothetical protein
MTDKSRIIVIIVVAMAIILAATAFAYNRYKKNLAYTAQQASGGPHIVEPRTKAEQNLYVFDNVLDSAGLLGKSVAESGIDEKYFQKEIFFELKFGGKLFSKEAGNCSIVYNQRDDEGEYFADTVYIYSYEVGFDEAAQELTKLYGEPTGTGEEPYVEANGGALSWADFENDGLKIKLNQGSENDYISITVKLK